MLTTYLADNKLSKNGIRVPIDIDFNLNPQTIPKDNEVNILKFDSSEYIIIVT